MDTYDVHFYCHWANYYWVVAEELPLAEAEELIRKQSARHTVHPNRGCCRCYPQKREH